MTTTNSKTTQSITYTQTSIDRARRAIRCAPFQLPLYATMQTAGVFLGAIAKEAGVRQNYTESSLPELVADNHLLWLISVGVLRREVDGQGITDSFRLTPLGRKLTQEWQESASTWKQAVTGFDRCSNWVSRWLRLPF